MLKKCAKGHIFDSVMTERCPKCATQTDSTANVSDDDVLAIMAEPEPPREPLSDSEQIRKSLSGSAIMRRKKICPQCSHEASYSFVYCPRCGAPLKVASLDIGPK
jgi:hypothetical protein